MRSYPLAMLVMLLCGCSIFNNHEQTLRINSTPRDATAYINGKAHACPLELSVPRDEDVNIRVEKVGFYPFETVTRKTLSGYGITDAVSAGFLLFPAIGLMTPGAWELTKTDFDVLLVPIPQR